MRFFLLQNDVFIFAALYNLRYLLFISIVGRNKLKKLNTNWDYTFVSKLYIVGNSYDWLITVYASGTVKTVK